MVIMTRTMAQGASVIVTLPAEVVGRLAIEPGQMLYWRESGLATYTVSALDPVQVAALEAMEEAIDQYREVFAALAE